MFQQDEALAAVATGGNYLTSIDAETSSRRPARAAAAPPSDVQIEEAVNYILDDCFFAVGQAVGRRKSVDHTAIIWWRDHFHTKFLRTLRRAGNTWMTDRSRVTAVGGLLGTRAVSHAGDRASIDLASAMRAAADVEKYCALRASRRSRSSADADTGAHTGARPGQVAAAIEIDGPRAQPDNARALYAGYWCAP